MSGLEGRRHSPQPLMAVTLVLPYPCVVALGFTLLAPRVIALIGGVTALVPLPPRKHPNISWSVDTPPDRMVSCSVKISDPRHDHRALA